MGWLSAFDLRLEQDVKNKLLRHRAGSHWKAYVNREHKDTTVRKERMDWCCSDFESPLPDLLQEVIDRLDEPGLSPQAIQAIVKDLTTDFGLTTFLPTLAADQRRFVEYWPTHLIYKLLTCPYSEIRGLTEDEDIPDVMGSVLHDTILQLRPRFQEVRQTALVATGHMSYVRDDPFAALESD